MRAELSRALDDMLKDHKVQQIEVSLATGASEKIVQRWKDENRDETISLVDVVGTGLSYPEVARDLLTWAAEQLGLAVVPRGRVEGAPSLFSALGDAEDAGHAVQRALIEALHPEGDGGSEITTGELEGLRARAAKLRSTAHSIELAANAALVERAPTNGPRVIEGGRK